MPQRPMVSTSSRSASPAAAGELSGATASVSRVVAVVAVVTVIASPHPWGLQTCGTEGCVGRHCEACPTGPFQVKHLSEHLRAHRPELWPQDDDSA